MNTSRLLNRKLPVLYRWVRRRRYFAHAVILSCVFFFGPVGFIGGIQLSHFISANQAQAATQAMVPAVMDDMRPSERRDYAATLQSLVRSDPDKMYQLVGGDVQMMFSQPDLKKHDGQAEIWQYRTASCVLDVYFKQGDGEHQAVSYYEVRQRKMAAFGAEGQHESDIDPAQCLASIYKARAI